MREITRKEFEKYTNLGKLAHPDQVMNGLIKTITEIGAEKFLHGAGLNKDRDSFIAVIFTYAVRKWAKREWFIQQIEDPPDFYIISPTDRPIKEKPMDRLGVEIVEIRDEITTSAIATLERTKLTNYAPGDGTVLLIFINSKIGIINLRDINLWVVRNRDKFKAFSEVYILFLGKFTPETAMTYTLVNTFKVWSQTCILKEEFNKGIIFPHVLIDKFKIELID